MEKGCKEHKEHCNNMKMEEMKVRGPKIKLFPSSQTVNLEIATVPNLYR
jgi:hypothetical protein